MQQQHLEFMEKLEREHMQRIQNIKDQADTTNSTLGDIPRSQTDAYTRLERLERASPDLNPLELRTNPSDGNFRVPCCSNPSNRAISHSTLDHLRSK